MGRFYGRKVDSNHADIREAFRSAGWLWQDLHRLGKGAPDGMVKQPIQFGIYLIEVKRREGKRNPKPSTNAKPATKKAQAEFAAEWGVHVLTTVEEVKDFIAARDWSVEPHRCV